MGKYYIKKQYNQRCDCSYPAEVEYIKHYLEDLQNGVVLCSDMRLEELFIDFSKENYNMLMAPLYSDPLVLRNFSEWLLNKE